MRCVVLVVGVFSVCAVQALFLDAPALAQEQLIPILSVTGEQQPTGSVSYVVMRFEERTDHDGLILRFHDSPGRFSMLAKDSTERAIRQAAASLGLSTDSWTVDLKVPYEGVTVSGDSLSAMVGVTVSALAQGRTVQTGHVLTGTVKADGAIGPVGAVPLKVQAARSARLRLVLIPHQQSLIQEDQPAASDLVISPVRSVPEALEALTTRALLK
ncbi:MAG TPA: S16 family serine protease [Nitrospira sp.]|nr:S16 family serine protease [Nitrospira sp.]